LDEQPHERDVIVARLRQFELGVVRHVVTQLPAGSQTAVEEGYAYGSGESLHVAVIDETQGAWLPAIMEAARIYGAAARLLQFQWTTPAHITVMTHRYVREGALPSFPGSAILRDAWAVTHRMHYAGEIQGCDVYLNDAAPPSNRVDLLLHELGHALGLERHSADLGIAQLARRYGWR
jgi:hypothetical protein